MSKIVKNKNKNTKTSSINTEQTSHFSFNKLPVWAIPLFLFSMTLVFFMPFILSGGMIFGSDMMNSIANRQFFVEFVKEFGKIPWWNPVLLSGMPTLEAFFSDMFYPLAALQFLFDIPMSIGYKYLVSVFMAGSFMYLFLRKGLNFSVPVSLIFSVAYMFNTEFVSHFFPGHDGKMFVRSLLPLGMFSLHKLLIDLKLKYAALMALAIGLFLLTSHIQTTYFVMWGMFLYFAYITIGKFRQDKDKKQAGIRIILFVLAISFGMGFGAIQFIPPYKYTKTYSVRGDEGDKTSYEHATSWSMHPEEAASLFVPEFCGFNHKGSQERKAPAYWGRNMFRLNSIYSGIVALVLAIFFFVLYRKDSVFKFWGILGIVSIIFALGANTPIFYLFYYFVPGVKLFRAPDMIMFWFVFSVIVMAATGLNRITKDGFDNRKFLDKIIIKKSLFIFAALLLLTLVVSGGQSLILSIWKGVFYTMPNQKEQAFIFNYPSFIKGAWFALFFGGLSLFLVIKNLKGEFKSLPLFLILFVLITADLFRVDSYFYKTIKKDHYGMYLSVNDPVLNQLKEEHKKEKFRVFPVPAGAGFGRTDAQMYGLEDITGFHDNELAWYSEFKGGDRIDNFLYTLRQNKYQGNPFLDLLNVKYYLIKQDRRQAIQVVPNPSYLPRAFVVSNFELVSSTNEAIYKLKSNNFPYRTKVLLEEKPSFIINSNNDSSNSNLPKVKWDYSDGQDREYKVNVEKPAFLVMSEVYFPHFKATVNGTPTKILKCNGAIMAIELPAGNNVINVVYDSPYIGFSSKISFFSLFIIVGVIILGYRRKKKETINA